MLLWRGSRDGFLSKDFHLRFDVRAPTLALIKDSGGKTFSGDLSRWNGTQAPGRKRVRVEIGTIFQRGNLR
jgi:hypothetical protein